jgi:chromate transporter
MSLSRQLFALILVFAPMSLLSFGGGQTLVPEIQHQSVIMHHWLRDTDFADLYGLARAAPGPSTLIVALIGWQVAGFWGALAAALAIFLPSSLLVYWAGAWWQRNRDSEFRKAMERGLTPVAAGLIFAGPMIVLKSAHAGWLELATTAAACAALAFTRAGTYAVAGSVVGIYAAIYFLMPHMTG